MTKSYHIMNWVYTYSVSYSKEFELFVIIFGVLVEVLLFFHQEPQLEKESGAEGEEDIRDSQEPLWTIPYIEDNRQLHTTSYISN